MKIQNKILIYFVCSLVTAGTVQALWAPSNFFRPDDPALHVPYHARLKYLLGAHAEFGSRKTGIDASGTRQNVLAIHDETQSVVAMFRNPVTGVNPASITVSGEDISIDGFPLSDPKNPPIGRLAFTGKYDENDVTFFARQSFDISHVLGSFSWGVFLPIKKKEIKDFKLKDLTKTYVSPGAQILHDTIIKDQQTLVSHVKTYGDLILQDYRASGFGDLVVSFEWFKDFSRMQQQKNKKYKKGAKIPAKSSIDNSLSMCTLWVKGGVAVPTGKDADINNPFSCALGNDGLWGFPFGAGLDIEFGHKMGAGVAFDVTLFADKTDDMRLKTHKDQTEFLLLNKGRATRDMGALWDFTAYVRALQIFSHFNLRMLYEYTKHEDNTLFAKSDEYLNEIINTAQSLKGWYAHSLAFALEYDLERDKARRKVAPEISFFFKLPLDGRSVIDLYTLGGQLSVSF